MKRILVGLLLMAGVAAHAEYSSYFYLQVDDSVADFSYLDVKQWNGTFTFSKHQGCVLHLGHRGEEVSVN